MRAAPVARTWASRIADRPAESRTTFDTVAFTDQRATADQTSAKPSSGCGVPERSTGSGWSGASTTAGEPIGGVKPLAAQAKRRGDGGTFRLPFHVDRRLYEGSRNHMPASPHRENFS